MLAADEAAAIGLIERFCRHASGSSDRGLAA
jgi:hypothetical protein